MNTHALNKFKDNTYFLIPSIVNNKTIFKHGFVSSRIADFAITKQLELVFDISMESKYKRLLMFNLDKEPYYYNIYAEKDILIVRFSIPNSLLPAVRCAKILQNKSVYNVKTINDSICWWN
jgi:hypothetical protein